MYHNEVQIERDSPRVAVQKAEGGLQNKMR